MKLRVAPLLLVIAVVLGCDTGDRPPPVSPFAVLADDDEVSDVVGMLRTTVSAPRQPTTTLQLLNRGTAPYIATRLSLIAEPVLCPTASPALSVSTTASLQVLPGGFTTFDVVHDPLIAGEGCALLVVETTDPARPRLTALVTIVPDASQRLCVLELSPIAPIVVGTTSTTPVTLRVCDGAPAATLSSISLDASFPVPFTLSDVPPLPARIVGDETITMSLHFTPPLATTTTAQVAFITDTGDVTTLPITATALPVPDCRPRFDPDIVRFPSSPFGGTATIHLTNDGTTSCTIAAVSAGDDLASFGRNLTTGVEVLAGAHRDVSVDFRPSADGAFAETPLSVTFTDGQTITVIVGGEGLPRSSCVPVLRAGATRTAYAPPTTLTNVGLETALQLDVEGERACRIGRARIVDDERHAFAVIASPAGTTVTPGAFSPAAVTIVRRPVAIAGVDEAVLEIPWHVVDDPADTAEHVVRVPLRAVAEAPCLRGPPAIRFATTTSTASQLVEFVNCGARTQVEGVAFVGVRDPRASLSVPPLGGELAPGASFAFSITVDASRVGEAGQLGAPITGAVAVSWGAGERSIVPFAANFPDDCTSDVICDRRDALLDFGRVDVGDTSVIAVACTNRGDTAATIDAVSDGPFAVVGGAGPLLPGIRRSVQLAFAPTTSGSFNGALALSDDSCSTPLGLVSVFGEATTPAIDTCVAAPATSSPLMSVRAEHVWTTPIVATLFDGNGDAQRTDDEPQQIVGVGFEGVVDGGGSVDDIVGPVLGRVMAWSVDGVQRLRSTSLVSATTTPAVADLDGDGTPEIIALRFDDDLAPTSRLRGQLVAFDIRGDELWRSARWSVPRVGNEDRGAIAVGDIDGNGFVEIAYGDHVFSADGALLWRGDARFIGSAGEGPRCFFVDVVGDRTLELVCGPRIYDAANGVVLAEATDGEDGVAAIADVDTATPTLIVRGAQLQAYRVDGSALVPLGASTTLPTRPTMTTSCDDALGPCVVPRPVPTVANIDGVDGDEVIVASGALLLVLRPTATGFIELARLELADDTARAPATAFDVDGDGHFEIIVADRAGWRLVRLDPVTFAATTLLTIGSASIPNHGAVVVADVDNDGHADIVRANALPFSPVVPVSIDVVTSSDFAAVTTTANQAESSSSFTAAGVALPTSLPLRSRYAGGICAE